MIVRIRCSRSLIQLQTFVIFPKKTILMTKNVELREICNRYINFQNAILSLYSINQHGIEIRPNEINTIHNS